MHVFARGILHGFWGQEIKGFLTMPVANVIDVTWVLSEETGRLRYESLRRVRRNPRQKLIVEHVNDTVTSEWIKRYQRIAANRKLRGIDNG